MYDLLLQRPPVTAGRRRIEGDHTWSPTVTSKEVLHRSPRGRGESSVWAPVQHLFRGNGWTPCMISFDSAPTGWNRGPLVRATIVTTANRGLSRELKTCNLDAPDGIHAARQKTKEQKSPHAAEQRRPGSLFQP